MQRIASKSLAITLNITGSCSDRAPVAVKPYLGRCQPSEGEHANLAGDEGPVLVRVQLVEMIPQHLAHCLRKTNRTAWQQLYMSQEHTICHQMLLQGFGQSQGITALEPVMQCDPVLLSDAGVNLTKTDVSPQLQVSQPSVIGQCSPESLCYAPHACYAGWLTLIHAVMP